MKKFLAIALIAASFTACNEGEKKAEETTPAADTAAAVVTPPAADTAKPAVVDTAAKPAAADTTKK